MIPNTITINDLGGVTGTTLVLDKVSEQNGESVFLGSYVSDSGNNRSVRMSVKHTIPADVTKSSSHLVKLDITRFNADGTVEKTMSIHTVLRSSSGPVAVQNAHNATVMTQILSDSGFSSEFTKGAF